MALEIERKFLLKSAAWRAEVSRSQRMVQAYLANTDRASTRVRIAGDKAWLNVKAMAIGPARAEFEYAIPVADAQALLPLCADGMIDKVRHIVERDGVVWEIDEFSGRNAGLLVAEVELQTVEQVFIRPSWLAEEVTNESRYYNVCLTTEPFDSWTDK